MASLFCWFYPVEAFQGWALNRAGSDPYAQFEATGIAEAVHWCGCWLMPPASFLALTLCRRRRSASSVLDAAIASVWQITTPGSPSGWSHLVSGIKRMAIIAVLGLAAVHAVMAFRQRFKDWPYYRLLSSDQMLPNISESNREVIRYLRTTTPENARILVVSDQKLFFLSYHLRPRLLFHRMHPSAEHLIPRAHQARQLAAYRLSDLPSDVWDCHPDYVLEYFEGADYVEPQRVTEDSAWIRFYRERTGDPAGIPSSVVVLRPHLSTGAQP
ncbi:MAG: hypothetical protein DWH91_10785 [Planctomycetota bacterium]|nr:MAG: hypothetical protein DWH91_10785 [Planctomycetota bacterium]